MKIRTESIIAIAAVTLIFFTALLMVALFVIQPSFTNLETKDSELGVAQTLNALNYTTSQLKSNLLDCADWDDTYNFAQNQNQNYITSNMMDSTFVQLDLNLLMIVNNSGVAVYCQSFDTNNSLKVATSDETQQSLIEDPALWNFSSLYSVNSGLMLLDQEPVLVATAPILTSNNQGPASGAILFGRYLDSSEIGQLQQITSCKFTIDSLTKFQQNSARIASLFSSHQTNSTEAVTPSVVTRYTLLNDIDSNPLFVLQTSQPRTDYQQGVWVEDIFLIAAIGLTITLGVTVSVLLEVGVVRPMTKLASQIESMPLNSELSKSNSKFDADEIAIVANSAKDILSKKFEAMTEVSRMVGHDLRNPLAGIRNATYILKKNYSSKLEEKGNAQLKTIEDCIEYSDKIIRDLLEYSCVLNLDKTEYSIRALLNDTLSSLVTPSNVKVLDEVKDETKVLVDHGQIQRVLSNIVKNAFDAMDDGGTLKISSKKTSGFVLLRFTDSGSGISS